MFENNDAEMRSNMMTGRLIGGRYEIIEEIGKGGMAVVYKAKCTMLNRYVALKVLRPEFREDKDFIQRFKIEAQSAGSLSHPNIVSIYDVGQDGDIDYIVMEYVEGVTLKQYIDAKGVIPWKEAVDYAAQICSGLEHAHKKGIIHKDIKPHNVIITREGTLKITDFGIAKVMSTSTITTGGAAMGSVHYFSPEQARGGYTDAKTDIYSLGVLMYEMVTGKLPFAGDSAVAVAMQHIEKPPVPPRQLNPDIPQSLENVILRAMSKEQSRRYESATKMIIDLKKVYLGTPVAYDSQVENGETVMIPDLSQREHVMPDELLGHEGKSEEKKKGKKEKTPQQKKKDRIGVFAGVGAGVLIVALLSVLAYFFLFRAPDGSGVELPDFRNMTIEDAEKLVEKTQLKIVVDGYQQSAEIEKDKIISQNPEPKKKVKDDATVKVIVSLGGEGGTMPDLVNKKSADAQDIILGLKLRPNVVDEASDTIPQGYVIRQSPTEGAKYKDGDTVTIYVSSGKDEKMVPVPNLLGKTEEDAKAALLDAGLTWGQISTVESSRTRGTVAAQSIREGVEVKEKTAIDLRISAGPSRQDESTPTPVTRSPKPQEPEEPDEPSDQEEPEEPEEPGGTTPIRPVSPNA